MPAAQPTTDHDRDRYDHEGQYLSLIRDACAENQVALLLVTHSADVASQFERVEKLSDFNRQNGTAGQGGDE